jgi:hypothetical protein
MTTRTLILTAALAAVTSVPALAQTAPAAAQAGQRVRSAAPAAETPRPRVAGTPDASAPAPSTAVAAPRRREGQPVNVKVDVTVTDQRGGAAPLKKTITIVVADSMGGRIRSTAESTSGFNMPLNVDAEPQILADGKIRLMLNLQYDLPNGGAASEAPTGVGVGVIRRTQLQENLPLVLENGKSMVVAQSADPIGDRQVTVEVKATVLR